MSHYTTYLLAYINFSSTLSCVKYEYVLVKVGLDKISQHRLIVRRSVGIFQVPQNSKLNNQLPRVVGSTPNT